MSFISHFLQWIIRVTTLLFNFGDVFIHPSLEKISLAVIGILIALPDTFYTFSMILIPNSMQKSAVRTEYLFQPPKKLEEKSCERLKLLEIASLQLAHSKPVVSCGMFEIDLKFLFIMLTGQFSILTMLVQFQVGGNLKFQ